MTRCIVNVATGRKPAENVEANYIHTVTDPKNGEALYVRVQFDGVPESTTIHPSRVVFN